jgi:hypothetical protein
MFESKRWPKTVVSIPKETPKSVKKLASVSVKNSYDPNIGLNKGVNLPKKG